MRLDYFDNTDAPEEERRERAFELTVAARESLTLATNRPLGISYETALNTIRDLSPDIHSQIVKLINTKNESEMVQRFIQLADATSQSPLELVQKEIELYEQAIESTVDKKEQLEKYKIQLWAAKEYFEPNPQSENRSLNRDYNLASRDEKLGKPIKENDHFKDYKLTNSKVLRLRLLHPDKAEAILGVDLVYENYDLTTDRVRIAHMQYKTWNENVLYLSSVKNLETQLKKMKQSYCSTGLCKGPKNKKRTNYRFPYCSAFLRPTSKVQSNDSKLLTTGIHIPVCKALSLFKDEQKISKKNSKNDKIKGHIFEEMFIDALAGSRWLELKELNDFYNIRSINAYDNYIRLYAQEVDLEIESEKNKDL